MSTVGPDLWGVWSRLEALRAQAVSPRFASWREAFLCSLDANATPDGSLPSARAAQDAAFGFVLTGEDRYALRALELLGRVRDDPSPWLHPGHAAMYPDDPADLETAETTKACATAVSWLWPALSEDERRGFVAMVADRGGRAIHEGALQGCWWATALNSNWTAVLNSGLGFAALVLQESDPGTAATWLAFARARTVEMLDLAAEEGAGIEGAGYWLYCFGSLQDLVEALRNANSDDLYDHPFWSRCTRFLPYLALPDLSAWVNYGDTGYRGLGGSAFFHGVAARVGDPLAQWFGNTILERHGGLGWKNLVYYDPCVPERPISAEPPCRCFRSIHLASFRSGWDEDAVLLLLRGGSNAWSHMHLDLNSFFLTAYGERLASEPGPDHYSLAYWHSIEPAVATSGHNCIVVDGGHQRVGAQYAMSYDLAEAGDCYSRLEDHLSSPAVEMIRGDASSAYGDTLERAWRDIVYLKPDVFVIYDDLLARPARAQRNFEWLLHSECPISEVEGGLEARGDRARLLIQPVFPVGWEYKRVVGKTIPHADGKPLHCVSLRPYWHHKWNVNPARSPYPHWDPRGDAEPLYGRECRYLVVLQALRADAPARFAVERLEHGGAQGVRLQADDETAVVLFNHAGGSVDLGGVRTDAEKCVVRAQGGRCSWAVVRATTLSWEGRAVLESQTPITEVGETRLPAAPSRR